PRRRHGHARPRAEGRVRGWPGHGDEACASVLGSGRTPRRRTGAEAGSGGLLPGRRRPANASKFH
ncbi:hypothetical protein HMPREF0731_4244, partial [Pseudoroseomonas cervicalis ATCC 49957]